MGRSAARLLAAQGANVIVVARNVERLAETVAEIKVGSPSKILSSRAQDDFVVSS